MNYDFIEGLEELKKQIHRLDDRKTAIYIMTFENGKKCEVVVRYHKESELPLIAEDYLRRYGAKRFERKRND